MIYLSSRHRQADAFDTIVSRTELVNLSAFSAVAVSLS